MKTRIQALHHKNQIIENIIQAMTTNRDFLVVGHKKPDEDCVASTVAIALLLSKFNKKVSIYQSEEFQEQLEYLYNMCRFNRINVISSEEEVPEHIEVIISCDTPKPDMMDSCAAIDQMLDDREVITVEFDHHLGADSAYIGDEGYRFVDQASSTCEIIGILSYKINKNKALLEKYKIPDVLTRNVIVSILTGIIGDSNMGAYLRSKREKRYFRMISNLYNSQLSKTTTNTKYISSMQQIFEEIQRLSEGEEKCLHYIYTKRQFTDSIGYVVLHGSDYERISALCDHKSMTFVSKKLTDELADESQKLGLTVFQDSFNDPDFYQFKLRRSRQFKKMDLRDVLKKFDIKNGGGHEGAIGFRFPVNEIKDLDEFVYKLLSGIENQLKASNL